MILGSAAIAQFACKFRKLGLGSLFASLMTTRKEDRPMTEAQTNPNPKFPRAEFEGAKFEMPHFEIPKMEVPAAFREMAEKGISQAKQNYERMKSAAEEASEVIERTYTKASKGASDYGLKLIEVSRVNTNAALDFYRDLMTVKSLSEMLELSTAHARKQFETVTEQGKELAALAQRIATDSVEPIKDSVTRASKKAA
jgi:phasin